MSNNKTIIYLGCSGFPNGLAEIQKIILISKSVIMKGHPVTVVCKRGVNDKNIHAGMSATGNFEGIEYIYTAGTPFKSPRFIVRNYLKIKGVINEYFLLSKLAKNKKIDVAVLSTHSFYAVLYYYFLSKVFGFKTILNYVEFYSGTKKKLANWDKWLNDELFDKYAPRLTDGVFIISEFLISHLKKISPRKKYLKIPNLTDVERFKGIDYIKSEPYFLFCGDAGYFEIIEFIINSFEALNNTTGFLYLVINGNDIDKGIVKTCISNSKAKDRIKFFTKLTNKELSSLYLNSIALLIPLRPTLQDLARFPHKIGEYLASGSPVITTNLGEVKYYFKDMENMLIADEYDVKMFSEKMQFVLENREKIQQIGNNGKKIAYNQFDYRVNGEAIINFIDELNSKS